MGMAGVTRDIRSYMPLTFAWSSAKMGLWLISAFCEVRVMKVTFFAFMVLSVMAGIAWPGHPQVTLEITGGVEGDIVLELYANKAPITVANFIDYVQSGFYDGLIFHRVMEDFMIQGGGFDTSGFKKVTEPAIISESFNGLSNLRGTVAMARTSDPHSATSQFYINHIDNIPSFDPTVTDLDYGAIARDGNNNPYFKVGYCVFGRVVSGLDLVDMIAIVPVTDDKPDTDIIIERATLTQDVPVCLEKLPGDINGDCNIDLVDFVTMAQNWLTCNSLTPTCD